MIAVNPRNHGVKSVIIRVLLAIFEIEYFEFKLMIRSETKQRNQMDYPSLQMDIDTKFK